MAWLWLKSGKTLTCAHISQGQCPTLWWQAGPKLAQTWLTSALVLEGDLQFRAVSGHLAVFNHEIVLNHLGHP